MDYPHTYQYAWFAIGAQGHTFDPGWRVVPGITSNVADENGNLHPVVLIEKQLETQ